MRPDGDHIHNPVYGDAIMHEGSYFKFIRPFPPNSIVVRRDYQDIGGRYTDTYPLSSWEWMAAQPETLHIACGLPDSPTKPKPTEQERRIWGT